MRIFNALDIAQTTFEFQTRHIRRHFFDSAYQSVRPYSFKKEVAFPIPLAPRDGSGIIRAMQKNVFSVQTVSRKSAVAVKARSAQCFARHTHDQYGIGVLLAGAQRSWSGRGAVEAGPGDVITVNPGEVHDGAPVGENRTWAMLYIDPEKVGEMVLDIREGKSPDMEFFSPVIRERLAARRFSAAYAALLFGDDAAADERLMLLIASQLRDAPVEHSYAPSLTHAKARIDDDPTGHHPLRELADGAGLSRFQMVRNFARLTGLTPHAYVVQRRLDFARYRIRCGAELVEAAVAAGFADQSHFHRSFTRRYGLTPGDYAAAMR